MVSIKRSQNIYNVVPCILFIVFFNVINISGYKFEPLHGQETFESKLVKSFEKPIEKKVEANNRCVDLDRTAVTPKKYVIDLDKPPFDRWNAVAKDLGHKMKILSKQIIGMIPRFVRPIVEMLAAKLDQYLPKSYADEIRGFAKASDISLGAAVIPNIYYDALTYCTSIVARDGNGKIWHARNLDYHLPSIANSTQEMQELTIFVDFQRGGKTIYSGITFAGLIGLATGQRPNAFTISYDARNHGSWWQNVLVPLLDRRVQPVNFIIRNVLESATTYEEALYRLSNTITVATEYYILGGISANQGSVITKGRWTYDNIWTLQPPPGRWFLVETNYDHWKPAGDHRRQAAVILMQKMGQNITSSSLLRVLSTRPVCNSGTIFQTVMSAVDPDNMKVRVLPWNRP